MLRAEGRGGRCLLRNSSVLNLCFGSPSHKWAEDVFYTTVLGPAEWVSRENAHCQASPTWSTTGTHEVGDRIVLQVPCTVAHTQAPPPANKQINTCEFLKLFKIPSGYGKPCICNSSIVELRVWAWLKMQLASVIYETEGGVCPSAHRCFLCCFLPTLRPAMDSGTR